MASVQKQQRALMKQKAAKQKKILIGLAPVFLLVMVFMGPGLLKSFTGGGKHEPPPVIPADTSGGEATPAPAPGTGAAPSTAAPAAGTATTAAPTATTLDDTDDLSAAGPGQLVSFDRFVGRDPFRQGIESKPADAGGVPGGAPGGTPKPPKGGGSTGGSTGGTTGGSTGGTTGGSSGDAYTKATIEVNGVSEVVAEDGTFPESDPIFKLVKVTKGGIELGLVSGEFNAGDQTIEVKKGKTVTLVSQPDGLRYVIKLVSVG
jgi:hypothetical protein